MKNSDKNIFIGILILIISACSLFIKSIPVIWIGGFIWGISLIAKSSKNKMQYSFHTNEIEKEIITCDNCKQRIRVPKDKQRYINITCPHCKQNPFLSLSDRFNRSSGKTKLLWIGGGIISLSIIIFVAYKLGDTTNTSTVIPVSEKTISTPSEHIVPPVVTIPTNIVTFSNGEFLNKNSYYLQGSGELEISNGTSDDAVAKLVSNVTDKSIATVFIQANSNYTLKNISDGNYKLVFNLGHDWDTISKKFTRNPSYSVFDDSFDFSTKSDYDGKYYDRFRVTLNPVMGGTATTNDINPEEFINY